jgi:hypothetical protein
MATVAPDARFGLVDASTAEAAMQPSPTNNGDSWCVSVMNGARIERLGIVRAHDYEGAIHRAMKKFQLEDRQQRRLIVWREG